MNMATKMVLIAVMAIGFTFTGTEASASGAREHQLCHVVNMPHSLFTQRVKESLTADPSGNRLVEGCNATPAQFMHGVNEVPALKESGFVLTSVGQFAEFVQRLEERPFVGNACLAGMNGRELVVTCKRERPAKQGEVGYYHGNIMVFAGDCMNTVSYVAATTLGAVEVVGQKMSDPKPARAIAVRRGAVSESGCGNNNRYLTIRIYDAAAASNTCAVSRMHPATDMRPALTGKGRVGSYVLNGTEQEFSRMCGEELYGLANAGKIGWSAQQQPVEVVVLVGNQEYPVFTGTVQGASLVGADEKSNALIVNGDTIRIPDIYDKGIVVAHFPNGSLRSVTESGIGADLSQMTTGCRRNVFTAIEGGGNGNQNPVAWE